MEDPEAPINFNDMTDEQVEEGFNYANEMGGKWTARADAFFWESQRRKNEEES